MTLAAPTLLALTALLPTQAADLEFTEAFAFGPDRAAALEQLIPGTTEHYFYSCLERQGQNDLDAVERLLADWESRHGRDSLLEQIENRQALLAFDLDPAAAYALLQRRLGLRFQHRRQVPGEVSSVSSSLDQERLSRTALTARAFDRHSKSLRGFRDSAFDFLAVGDLDENLRRKLLERLDRPDLPGLPNLVVSDLRTRRSGGFGSIDIHGRLLLEQLEECLAQMPDLLQSEAFVHTWLRRLVPGADEDITRDAGQREAYLTRLETFTRRLPATWNSLRAHVLHHRLRHDLAQGQPDRERFLAYLRLPRSASYTTRDQWKPRLDRGEVLVDLNQDYPTGLAKVGNDEPLVRAYLAHFFSREESYEPYASWVSKEYLRRLFAETRILAGLGDMEQWYEWIDDPAYYEALLERVEIEFAPTQPIYYGATDPVAVEVDVKNVRTLLVKVFEVNAFNYYREEGREVGPSIDLDGLVAGEEQVLELEEGPLRRVRRRFELPSLAGPGVYVVELIGGGISSRAVIHKGQLQVAERLGAAGHVLEVLDEAGNQVADASAWFGGREYGADSSGGIVLPYSTDPGRRQLILRGGGLTTLSHFDHAAETYELEAGRLLERETLVPGATAHLVLRPALFLNGELASLALLEEPRLIVDAVDHEGISARLEVSDLDLSLEEDLVQEIQVPEGVSSLTVRFQARVESLSEGRTVNVTSEARSFPVNAIDATLQMSSPLLSRSSSGYSLHVLGKNGEPRKGRVLSLTMGLEHFTDDLDVELQTDARGRIELGHLEGVRSLAVLGFRWPLRDGRRTYPGRVHGAQGQVLRVPAPVDCRLDRQHLSLFEVREGAFVRDAHEALAVRDGYVELSGLAPGDYDLLLRREGRRVEVRVADGSARDGWVIGEHRRLARAPRALQVVSTEVAGEELLVRLDSARRDARVHVWSTRFLPAYDPYLSLAIGSSAPLPRVEAEAIPSAYHSGREIGDEYRYILERRYADKYPGNMLRRPSLLLNPWALQETTAALGIGGGAGGATGGRFGGKKREREQRANEDFRQDGAHPSVFANLDFLPDPPAPLLGLRPDEDGLVRVPLAELGEGSLLHILALDTQDTVYHTAVRDEVELVPEDQRLLRNLDPQQPLANRRAIELVEAGGSLRIANPGAAEVKVYDTLASVFQVYRTLNPDPELARFEFMTRWPGIDAEEKRSLYSEYACHELHLFLFERDPDFFAEVVRPYLEHKLHKTFLDEWLLGRDLSGYVDPWAFGQLNLVERLLLLRRLARGGDGERLLREQVELLAPDLARESFLFETSLRSGGLERSRGLAAAITEHKSLADGPSSPGPVPPGAPPSESLMDREVEEEGVSTGSDDFFLGKGARDKDAARRSRTQALFRNPDDTQVLAERDYWHLRIEQVRPGLIPPSEFWLDFARSGDSFRSPFFAEASHNRTEILLALALLDLPFEAGEQTTRQVDGTLVLETARPLLVVREELEPATFNEARLPVQVRQNLFRSDDRYRHEQGQRLDKYVGEELLVDVAYGAQVVVTNPTSTPREVDLLLQIPAGAIPLQRGLETRGERLGVGPFQTATYEYYFYFPAPGSFAHYPVHVSQQGDLIAAAEAQNLEVLLEPSRVDTTSWPHVSQNGTLEEVLTYLEGSSLRRTDLGRIAWRMRDREAYDAVLAHLRGRLEYSKDLWSYGVFHRDVPTAQEYLRTVADSLSLGTSLESPLLTIDPVDRKRYQHLEFDPLFHPRAHRFGKEREILDQGFAQQYGEFLEVMAYRGTLDADDWMSVTYYLLLQDRVGEALEAFASVDVAQLETRLQYDYMQAYIGFFGEDPSGVRAIAEAYQDHPVERWRERFQDVLRQLDEAEGNGSSGAPGDEREAQLENLAALEASLDLSVEARRVEVAFANLDACDVSYYEMDIEFLFSTSPFVQQGSGSFAYVEPGRRDRVQLGGQARTASFDLPEEFHGSNVLVEVRGGGVVRREAYFAHSLDLRMMESMGQLAVHHDESGAPLPRTYIKVYARDASGQVRFHKDGYTDLRGRFDYVSVSGPTSGRDTERYSILVLHEEHGAMVREVAAPQR